MTSPATAVRLLTWNIHAGIGPDGRRDLERVVALVRRQSADIVALQEVDTRGGGGGVNPFTFLAQSLGPHAAEARTITAADGHYGHVLISRWPLSPPVLHDLSISRHEPRIAIEVKAKTEFGALHVVAVHLGLRIGERRRQAALLAEVASTMSGPAVIMGDFNEWTWGGSVRRALRPFLPACTEHRTFPAHRPLLVLDRLYVSPAAALKSSWADPAGAAASDHLPVVGDVWLP